MATCYIILNILMQCIDTVKVFCWEKSKGKGILLGETQMTQIVLTLGCPWITLVYVLWVWAKNCLFIRH